MGLGISMGGLSILVIFVGAILFCELVFIISSFTISSSQVAPPLFITFFIIFLPAYLFLIFSLQCRQIP